MYNYYNCSTPFVSQKDGHDDLSGLSPKRNGQDGPFATVERAIDMVAELRIGGNMRPVTIAFCDDYYISSPIIVSAENLTPRFGSSYGVDGITFSSYGASKKIVGGIKLSEWKNDVFNGKDCISCTLEKVGFGKYPIFTDLLVNGKRADMTRFPKDSTLKAIATENPWPVLWEITHPSKWFDAKKEDLENIEGIEDAIVSFYHYWIDEHSPVESYDKETGRLTLKYPSRFNLTAQYEPPISSDLHFYLENLPGFFERENEWYLDRKEGKVYYIPENGLCPDDIEAYAPLSESIFEIKGYEDHPVFDIHIENLHLICTKGDYASCMVRTTPDTYEKSNTEFYASDIQSVCMARGAVNFNYAHRCSVSCCDLCGLGVHGISIEEGCRNIRIENNRITETAGGGIRIFGAPYGCASGAETANISIRKNLIRNIGLRYEASCGILLCHSHDNEISENEICYTGYSGISCGWVWGYKDSITYGNIIKNNHIHHIGRGKMSDLGAIYTLGIQKGTVLSGNHIHDITSNHYGGNGIYLDEGSSGIIVENNIVHDTKTASFLLHYGKNNIVRNNIFAFGKLGIEIGRREMHENLVFERNIFVTEGNTLIARSDFSPMIVNGNNNIVFDTKNDRAALYRSDNTAVISGNEDFCTELEKTFGAVFCDPKFKNLESRNFEFCEDSPVFEKIGFIKII